MGVLGPRRKIDSTMRKLHNEMFYVATVQCGCNQYIFMSQYASVHIRANSWHELVDIVEHPPMHCMFQTWGYVTYEKENRRILLLLLR
jgi:hypothetical protein